MTCLKMLGDMILGSPDRLFEPLKVNIQLLQNYRNDLISCPFGANIYASACRLKCWMTSIKIHQKMVPFWSPHGAIYAVSTHCYSFSSLISSCPRRGPKLQNRQGEIQISIDRKDSLLCKKLPGYIILQLVTYYNKRIGERKNNRIFEL